MLKYTDINKLAGKLGSVLLNHHLKCAVAESCTGGSLAAAITHIAGSSKWFDRGFVAYTNQSKEEMLGVDNHIIAAAGAVSEATVRAMSEGVLKNSHADVSTAITGIAGPSGGTPEKPVGTVWIGWSFTHQPTRSQCYLFKGNRAFIRQQAVEVALDGLIQFILNRE